MTRVLVVEDEESYADALSYLLRKEGYDVSLAATGPDALAEFDRNGADIVLLDLMLPGLPGTEVCRQIRAVSNVPVIMVSAKDDEVDKIVGLELGADDYVTKPYSPRELVARIRAVLRRGIEPDLAPMTLEAGSVRMDVERHVVTVDGEPQRLPLKEFELLELFLRNPGRVLTRGQLIDRVWGSDYVGDTKTLDVHVKRLRAKLETDPSHPTTARDGARARLQARPLGAVRRVSGSSPRRRRRGTLASTSLTGRTAMRRLAELVLAAPRAGRGRLGRDRGRRGRGHQHRERPDDRQLLAARAAGRHRGQQDRRGLPQRREHHAAARHRDDAGGADASPATRTRWRRPSRRSAPSEVPLRVVDEGNTGDKAFRTSDDRTAYAMVFYPFPQSLGAVLPTKEVQAAVQAAAPQGAVVGRHRHGRPGGRRRVRRQRRPHRDAARGARRARGAAVRLRLRCWRSCRCWWRPSRSSPPSCSCSR